VGALHQQQSVRCLQSLKARIDAVEQLILPLGCQRFQRVLPARCGVNLYTDTRPPAASAASLSGMSCLLTN
jgi:hypothetical protein